MNENNDTTATGNIWPAPTLNRKQRRSIEKATKRNLVRQFIPENIIRGAFPSLDKHIPEKVIWHKKFHNMPRLYPGFKKNKDVN